MAKASKKATEDRRGFGEAPQSDFEGAPLEGSVADWAEQMRRVAEAETVETRHDVASKAGKHRRKAATARGKPREARSGSAFKTARGTSMGGSNDPKTRAGAGLNAVAGMDVALEDAGKLSNTGVTATVEALSKLIESGNPLHKNGQVWTPHRPARPEKSEGGRRLRMVTDYAPSGDQPTAIADLVAGAGENERTQVLLGVTGSGKTFTMAKVIEETQRPAVILAPNKTLAAQLYSEFRNFFPDNAVEYFVSYYDYYQPEAYVPRSDTYIEKESSINEQIDRMRHSATRALLERDDVIIVASVSCIYGIGSVETYTAMTFQMSIGDRIDQRQLLADLVAQQYKRRDADFQRGSFRVRGDTIEIFPAHLEDAAWRISLFGDEIDAITEFDPLTGHKTGEMQSVKIYANSHYVTPRPTLNTGHQVDPRGAEAPPRRAGEAPAACSRRSASSSAPASTWRCWRRPAPARASRTIRATSPAASRASRRRRCSSTSPTTRCSSSTRATSPCRRSAACIAATSAARRRSPNTASACPPAWTTGRCASRNGTPCARRPSPSRRRPAAGSWSEAGGVFAEQVIRPTGLIDPPVEVRPASTQVDDVLGEIRAVAAAGYRTLVHGADQAHGRGPDRISARAGHPRALHALRHRHAGAHRDHPRPAPRRLRLPRRHQPAARGPRHPRMRLRRHPRRRQGGLPALRDLADPDHRPRRAQRRRPRHPLCRHTSPAR